MDRKKKKKKNMEKNSADITHSITEKIVLFQRIVLRQQSQFSHLHSHLHIYVCFLLNMNSFLTSLKILLVSGIWYLVFIRCVNCHIPKVCYPITINKSYRNDFCSHLYQFKMIIAIFVTALVGYTAIHHQLPSAIFFFRSILL